MYDLFNSYNSENGLRVIDDLNDFMANDLSGTFLYVIFGSIKVKEKLNTYTLKKDDFLYLNCGESYELMKNSKDLLLCIIEVPTHVLNQNSTNTVIDCNSVKNSALDHVAMKETINRIINVIANDDHKKTYNLYELGFRFLNVLVKNYELEVHSVNEVDRIENIKKYILTNYNAKITLDDIANDFYMSQAYFSRYFKKEMGMNFTDYLSEIRLMKALKDIKSTTKSIASISNDHGFANISAFNKIFKERFQVTPSQYRCEFQKKHPISMINKKNTEIVKELKELCPNEFMDANHRMSEFTLDVKEHVKYKLNVNRMINVGSISQLIISNVQEQILELEASLKTDRLRIHDIFSEEMVKYQNDELILDYNKINTAFRFVTENKFQLFINLETPSIANFKSDTKDEEQFGLYLQKMEEALKKFLAYIMNQFMQINIYDFQFELTNNHNIETHRYAKVYAMLYSIIKGFSSRFEIGGPGIKANDSVHRILYELSHEGVTFDFITMISYSLSKDKRLHDTTTPVTLKQEVSIIKENLNLYKYKNLPLIVSDWDYSDEIANYINDTCYKGAYIVKNLQEVLFDVDAVAYNSFSDILIDFPYSNKLLVGLPGLLTKQGLRKPAFYAFKFFHHLKPYCIKQEEFYVATIEDNNIALLCHNYCPIKQSMMYKKNNLHINDIEELFQNEVMSFRFHFTNVENGKYEIRKFNINQTYGSIMDEWKKWDYLNFVTKTDVDFLMKRASPNLTIKLVEVYHHNLTLDIKMEPNEICIIYGDVIKE